VYAAGIRSIQHYTETLLGRLFTLALEAQGIQADVEFEFAEFRAGERLRDAQTESIEISNEQAKVNAGWTTDDEASETITGHKAQGVKAVPVAPPPSQQPGIGNTDGQPAQQQDQQRWLNEIVAARAEVAKAMEMVSYGHSPLSAGIPLNGEIHVNGY
jgi:hypothetical protein